MKVASFTFLFSLFTFLFSLSICAQTNPRAWYADGQVWITWNINFPLPETVGIYASENPFTDVNDAVLIGRPFLLDYLPVALKEQVDTAATYRIPNGQGGVYQLQPNEGLFVYTPHQAGAAHIAVVPFGQTTVNASNITDGPVVVNYDPVNDPVECHLQAMFPSPFSPIDYRVLAYYMWCDGRADHRDGRPDFPVMANKHKNGMAGFFFVSVPTGLDTTQPFPMTVWLHGGGGTARQSLAGSRPIINIDPQEGILVAHNDDVYGNRGEVPPFIENPSVHFGYRQNWDPFSTDNIPTQPDTIINYTQRKYIWIDEWLIRTYNVDPARVHIQGHSMGSWGATGLAKAFPEHYASVVLFNNAFRGHESGNIDAMLGDPALRFPTSLRNREGGTVHYPDVFNITTNTAAYRDLPVFKSFHSKNDVGEGNYWGVEVVDNYHAADAAGHGMALYWSERGHGVDTGPDFDDHWVNGNTANQQTAVDDVAWGEAHYRSDVSYPAFFNHRLDVNALDPGDGKIGTGPNGSGDDWGTWGGWHRWETSTIVDEVDEWSAEAWLESEAVYLNDNSPHAQLTADLHIRRPQQFKPATGQQIFWRVEDVSTLNVLQSGSGLVSDDNLVRIDDVVVYREETRRVRIVISTEPVATHFISRDSDVHVYPNPSDGKFSINFSKHETGPCKIRLCSVDGKLIFQSEQLVEENTTLVIDVDEKANQGLYLMEMVVGNRVVTRKIVIR